MSHHWYLSGPTRTYDLYNKVTQFLGDRPALTTNGTKTHSWKVVWKCNTSSDDVSYFLILFNGLNFCQFHWLPFKYLLQPCRNPVNPKPTTSFHILNSRRSRAICLKSVMSSTEYLGSGPLDGCCWFKPRSFWVSLSVVIADRMPYSLTPKSTRGPRTSDKHFCWRKSNTFHC